MSFDPPKAAEQSLWPLPIKLPDEPDLIEKDKMVCLRDDGVNWSEYALPDQLTEKSEAVRRRIERGEPAKEEAVAKPTKMSALSRALRRRSSTRRLTRPAQAASSRLSAVYCVTDVFSLYRLQFPYAASTSLCIVGRQPAQQHIVDRLGDLCPPFSRSVTYVKQRGLFGSASEYEALA
ncbi:hypothetical protein Rt10032_c07g3234 [Rhodotorula toruloides]|uniref:Uncharacterized protein n=1 Tax=Rhodotorula toruloides TaxID=5286 RepID=A0A511KFR9_RHOTO|nr:hypothetical protein Rt10032_c07g3234 [Rhodotorula toruloides]